MRDSSRRVGLCGLIARIDAVHLGHHRRSRPRHHRDPRSTARRGSPPMNLLAHVPERRPRRARAPPRNQRRHTSASAADVHRNCVLGSWWQMDRTGVPSMAAHDRRFAAPMDTTIVGRRQPAYLLTHNDVAPGRELQAVAAGRVATHNRRYCAREAVESARAQSPLVPRQRGGRRCRERSRSTSNPPHAMRQRTTLSLALIDVRKLPCAGWRRSNGRCPASALSPRRPPGSTRRCGPFGHLGWLQERWIARNRRSAPAARFAIRRSRGSRRCSRRPTRSDPDGASRVAAALRAA